MARKPKKRIWWTKVSKNGDWLVRGYIGWRKVILTPRHHQK